MIERNPEDMTASELLRRTAKDIERNAFCASDAVSCLRRAVGSEETADYESDMANALEDLADRIDAEAAKTGGGRLSAVANAVATINDWPGFRAGEEFTEWMNRCWIMRPRYEDGEPVQFDDNGIDWGDTDECRAPSMQWNATAVACSGKLLATAFNKIVAVAKTDENGRVKRTAPEVLGADGKPIVEGETVWDTESGKELNVCAIANAYAGLIQCSDDDGVCEDYDARHLTHTPPDTQDRIDADVMKSATEYWMCGLNPCGQCPVRIDGKTPAERYETGKGIVGCRPAMLFDLLCRQRKLDNRTGGE